jgi:hypothetical protein
MYLTTQEAVLPSKIEGTQTSLEEVLQLTGSSSETSNIKQGVIVALPTTRLGWRFLGKTRWSDPIVFGTTFASPDYS